MMMMEQQAYWPTDERVCSDGKRMADVHRRLASLWILHVCHAATIATMDCLSHSLCLPACSRVRVIPNHNISEAELARETFGLNLRLLAPT